MSLMKRQQVNIFSTDHSRSSYFEQQWVTWGHGRDKQRNWAFGAGSK